MAYSRSFMNDVKPDLAKIAALVSKKACLACVNYGGSHPVHNTCYCKLTMDKLPELQTCPQWVNYHTNKKVPK